MVVIKNWDIELSFEHVLRALGGSSRSSKIYNPVLKTQIQRALAEGSPLLDPVVVMKEYPVKQVQHERILLSPAGVIAGKGIAPLLAQAEALALVVCSIGRTLDQYIQAIFSADPVYGMVLDAFGSAAIEQLSVQACSSVGQQAAERGWQNSVPYNPGMDGWPAASGQKQIFSLLDAEAAGISVDALGTMNPRKTLSMVIAMGADVEVGGKVCDYCSMRNSCRFKDHYE